ncbi:hypothetical protein CEXT_616871 [Caerostris extrusa]|uniref:Uncharacterized protein n=1 Tax=Caerostris extrusa TaxID=172846 RepID=A0AAV4QVI4_CAEEX|nr:hypothetical protein CEXT_616871 [Caerostris extrusa]
MALVNILSVTTSSCTYTLDLPNKSHLGERCCVSELGWPDSAWPGQHVSFLYSYFDLHNKSQLLDIGTECSRPHNLGDIESTT